MEKSTETEGTLFKIKRFSVHDGPGIRTSVFLKGCPLNCIWCHSPEGIGSGISIWHDKNRCIACGECVQACPEKALDLLNGDEPVIKIDRKLCDMSGNCVNVCPTGAMQFTGYKSMVSEVIKEVEKDILYYRVSGGGITLTGGEPLYQPEFSENILKECRKINIHTAIESCLFCDRESISKISPLVDLFIVDMKISDNSQHIKYTGKPNDLIKENFRYIAGRGIAIIVRIPMINNITDSDQNKNDIIAFVHEVDKQIPVEFVTFNPLAENNYKRLNIPFLLKEQ
jgi:pyruvate formate lyase activating enzyme